MKSKTIAFVKETPTPSHRHSLISLPFHFLALLVLSLLNCRDGERGGDVMVVTLRSRPPLSSRSPPLSHLSLFTFSLF
ncbi:hypothetical protein Hanom_Chr05g00439341 [Helianthus anomalus]